MATKTKAGERLGFKAYFGTTAMGFSDGITLALMTSYFMVYLTDYAGIGKWGAIIGGSVLLFARVFDAVNDPIEGWIMDRAKVGKYGKYKPFIILSIFLVGIGVIGSFFVPQAIADSPVVIAIWVLVFYLFYDIGYSFFAPNLIYRSLTLDSAQRGKLMIGPRLVGMILGMAMSGLIAMVNGVNAGIGNLHAAFGLTIATIVLIATVISLLGIALIKEKYHTPVDENSERVRLRDFVILLKENKAVRVKNISGFLCGCIWSFLFGAMLYYIKWAYCADLTTGAVDTAYYGNLALIGSMMMFLPLVIGTVIATPLMKLFGSAIKLHRVQILTQTAACGVMFLLHILGVLQTSPMLFFICIGVTAVGIGVGYIPEEVLKIECMDYEIYKNGKDRSALCNAVNKFVIKVQTAVATALVGAILVAAGYVVDSVTDTYLGELSSIPPMLNWFVVIMGLIPCILGFIAWLVLKQYPVTDEIRTAMKEKMSK